ncbi:IS30 family transposase, partial [Candidatus Wolfebacteria bacterium]
AGLSPEQIAGRLHLEYPSESISHEAIYQYIYSQVYRGGHGYMKPGYHDLRQYLKRRHRRRTKKGMRKGQRIFSAKGISIDMRPEHIEQRKEIGHWEGDSVVSRKSKVGLNTLVERKTGLVFISKIKNGTSHETTSAVVHRLNILPCKLRRTLTVDNGSENAGYKEITDTLNAVVYFAHPYSSWERGSNENTNGLIRWYFPKGTDFANVTDEQITMVEYMLNNRPRKRLGWKTPLEVFNESVALTD